MDSKWERNSAMHAHIVLKKAERLIHSNLGKNIRKHKLTDSQFSVIDVLYSKGEMRICHLMNKVLATAGNMTVVIKNMERDGLIYRKKDAEDKRAFLVGITEKGSKLFEEILPGHRQEIEDVFSVLNQEEKSQLISILKKFKKLETKSKD